MSGQTINSLVLSCIVPNNAEPGKTFRIKLESENRCFEVITPQGVKPGDVLNVVVPSKSDISSSTPVSPSSNNSSRYSLWCVLSDIVEYIKQRTITLNSQYKLADKILVIASPGKVLLNILTRFLRSKKKLFLQFFLRIIIC